MWANEGGVEGGSEGWLVGVGGGGWFVLCSVEEEGGCNLSLAWVDTWIRIYTPFYF